MIKIGKKENRIERRKKNLLEKKVFQTATRTLTKSKDKIHNCFSLPLLRKPCKGSKSRNVRLFVFPSFGSPRNTRNKPRLTANDFVRTKFFSVIWKI